MHTSALPPARAAKLYHSVLHMYYDVHLLSSLCFPHPSLIPSQLKISQVVRHVGVCPVPITLMTTTTISEIWEGRRRLQAQTPSSEPASPPISLFTSKSSFHRMKSRTTMFQWWACPLLQPTKAQALPIIYTNQQPSHMAGLYWWLY